MGSRTYNGPGADPGYFFTSIYKGTEVRTYHTHPDRRNTSKFRTGFDKANWLHTAEISSLPNEESSAWCNPIDQEPFKSEHFKVACGHNNGDLACDAAAPSRPSV